MEKIKESFQKVKRDMDFLYNQLDSLKKEMREMREEMLKICKILEKTLEKIPTPSQLTPIYSPTHPPLTPTPSTPTPTQNYPLEALKHQNMLISTGNEGVPTDKQTDKQTDIQHQISSKIEENSIDNAAEILNSLDNMKKEIRLKFKRLTDQELLVFSTLYQFDEEVGHTNYKTIAQKLGLTESSIRDYIGRLIKKGIPVEKKRINNKIILLSVSQNLKKIASLSTILQLRDL